MGRLISLVVAVILGAVIATAAAYGIVSSQTKAPAKNPAQHGVVQYGS